MSSMEESRTDSQKSGRPQKELSNSRKHKKRNSKKSARVDSWCSEEQSETNGGGSISNIDYTPGFWQQPGIPPLMQPPHNSQRLFTAMSDPGVCGYSTVPVAYTMEPVSMPPIYPLYRPVPQPSYSRAYRGRARRTMSQNHCPDGLHHNPGNIINGYSSLQENRSNYMTSTLYQNGDYASLPPTANNHTLNYTGELNSEHRRYSDPGLGPADLPPYVNSEDSDSEDSGSSRTTIGKNSKLVLTLLEQMTNLKEANSQLFKELYETKLSVENLKAELIRVKHHASSDYEPGMLSDIISDMRQANKVLDETMLGKMNTIVEEKMQQKMSQLDEIKERLAKVTEDKTEGDKRIAKLEAEVAALRINFNNEGREIAAFEEETLTLRRELQEARASRNISENHTTKLEKLVAILRKKMMNEVSEDDAMEAVIYGGMMNPVGRSSNGAAVPHTTTKAEAVDEVDYSDESDTSSYDGNNELSIVSSNSIGGPVTDL